MTSFSPYSKEDQLRPKRKEKKIVEYKEATEEARDKHGVLRCARCKRPLLDREAQRHHKKYRSQGGSSKKENLEVLCAKCHEKEHSHRK